MSIWLLALAALTAMAIGAGGAAATQVLPAATNIEAKSTQTLFLPENAYSTLYVNCTGSVARFKTPPEAGIDQNINRKGVGTESTGPGGVTADLTEPPSFTGCGIFEGATEMLKAAVKTNSTNGSWSITANGGTAEEGSAAIGVPKEGALIESALGNIEISPEESSVVVAPRYVNATQTLTVDSQIAFTGVGLLSPAQFEATYKAEGLEILP